jgi:hypothetical protein
MTVQAVLTGSAAVTALAITCVAMFPAMHQVIVWPKVRPHTSRDGDPTHGRSLTPHQVELDLFTAVVSFGRRYDV